MNLARSLLLLGREAEAATNLAEGYRLVQDPRLLEAVAEASVASADRIRRTEPKSPENLVRRLQLIKQAIDASPSSAIANEGVVQIAIECADDKENEVAVLRTALLQGVQAETMHFVQGTVALMRGDVAAAEMHLNLIENKNQLPGMMNNMAVMLSQKEDGDLQRALALSEEALKSLPQNPRLRETRGQILLKLERFSDAIPDLEFALREAEIAIPVHAALAKAYTRLGDVDLAALHQRLHDELQAAEEKP